jgi:hypothetical protein
VGKKAIRRVVFCLSLVAKELLEDLERRHPARLGKEELAIQGSLHENIAKEVDCQYRQSIRDMTETVGPRISCIIRPGLSV